MDSSFKRTDQVDQVWIILSSDKNLIGLKQFACYSYDSYLVFEGSGQPKINHWSLCMEQRFVSFKLTIRQSY